MNSVEILQISQYEVSKWKIAPKTHTHILHTHWHQHKLNNPWFLPSLNAFLLKMDSTSWNLTPDHFNLVEGGHLGTNDVMSIGKEIGKAVTRHF